MALMEAAGRATVPDALDGAAASMAGQAIRLYRRFLSPYAGRRCLFRVSCSDYAAQAFALRGWKDGVQESLTRLRRCGGSYSLVSDVRGRLTLVTEDGTEFEDDDLAGWLRSPSPQ